MTPREKFVYFIKPVNMDGPIKIGCSQHPKTRLLDLISWCPFPLEIIATAPGGYAEEARLHQIFAADRLRAEWFRTTRELLSFIENVSRSGGLPFGLIEDRYVTLDGLPAVLGRHGISTEQFAQRAGVQPACIYQWTMTASRSSVGRVLAALESFGIQCSPADLCGTPAESRAA